MNKIYFLSTCSTCARIMKELKLPKNIIKQDIKNELITTEQIDEMKQLAGSYEALFSRIALKYRSMGLNEMNLTEKNYKKYILQEYTFLKRPILIYNNQIFIGNSPKNIQAAYQAIHGQ